MLIDYFEENGVLPGGEIQTVSFKDIWIIESVEGKMVVRDSQNVQRCPIMDFNKQRLVYLIMI